MREASPSEDTLDALPTELCFEVAEAVLLSDPVCVPSLAATNARWHAVCTTERPAAKDSERRTSVARLARMAGGPPWRAHAPTFGSAAALAEAAWHSHRCWAVALAEYLLGSHKGPGKGYVPTLRTTAWLLRRNAIRWATPDPHVDEETWTWLNKFPSATSAAWLWSVPIRAVEDFVCSTPARWWTGPIGAADDFVSLGIIEPDLVSAAIVEPVPEGGSDAASDVVPLFGSAPFPGEDRVYRWIHSWSTDVDGDLILSSPSPEDIEATLRGRDFRRAVERDMALQLKSYLPPSEMPLVDNPFVFFDADLYVRRTLDASPATELEVCGAFSSRNHFRG